MFLVVIFYSWNSHRLLLEISVLIWSFPTGNFTEKVVKKIEWKDHKLESKLLLKSTKTRARKHGLARILTPRFALFAYLLILGRFHPCSVFIPTSTDIFLMMEAELTLAQNMKIIALWVSFLMPQESSNVELCRMRNYQNILD